MVGVVPTEKCVKRGTMTACPFASATTLIVRFGLHTTVAPGFWVSSGRMPVPVPANWTVTTAPATGRLLMSRTHTSNPGCPVVHGTGPEFAPWLLYEEMMT